MAGKVGKAGSTSSSSSVKRTPTKAVSKPSSSTSRAKSPTKAISPKSQFVSTKGKSPAATKPAPKSIQRTAPKAAPQTAPKSAPKSAHHPLPNSSGAKPLQGGLNDVKKGDTSGAKPMRGGLQGALQNGADMVMDTARVAKVGFDASVDAVKHTATNTAKAAAAGAKTVVEGAKSAVHAGVEGAKQAAHLGVEGAKNAAQLGIAGAKMGVENIKEGAKAGVDAVKKGVNAAQQGIDTVQKLGGVKNAYEVWKAARPSPEEQRSMEYLSKMLAPNKLGGADKTFNYGDKDAIVNALMNDKAGLKKEVVGQLMAEGKTRQASMAAKAIDGAGGVVASIARSKINRDAPQQIGAKLEKGLSDARIDPNTAQTPDTIKRDMTFNDMREFEQNAKVLQDMQARISNALGKDIVFPKGISQEALQHSLNGALGLPPGAQIVPRQ